MQTGSYTHSGDCGRTASVFNIGDEDGETIGDGVGDRVGDRVGVCLATSGVPSDRWAEVRWPSCTRAQDGQWPDTVAQALTPHTGQRHVRRLGCTEVCIVHAWAENTLESRCALSFNIKARPSPDLDPLMESFLYSPKEAGESTQLYARYYSYFLTSTPIPCPHFSVGLRKVYHCR